MKYSHKEIIFGIFFTIFLVWSRLWHIDQVPATLTHDEMVYAIQAKSFALQGTTLSGEQPWWSVKPVHPMYAEWPAQVMSLGFFIGDTPLLSAHIVSAIMGIAFPFIVASLVFSVWKRKDVAIATWVVFIFSPLFWQMSRLSYDAFFSVWFYVLAGALFIKKDAKSVFASIPFFILGFFQYQGFKLLLLPWMLFLLLLVLSTRIKKINKNEVFNQLKAHKYQLIVSLLGLCGTLFYGIHLLPQQEANMRLSSLIFNNTDYLSQIVNTERRLSLQNPFLNTASNKITAVLLFMLQRLVGVFDFNLLLVSIEPNVSGFSVWTHGVFYWIELFFLSIGLSILSFQRKTRASGILLVLGILTLCLPALINTSSEWYLLRSIFSYFLMSIGASWGLVYVYTKKHLKLLVVIIYAVSVANFSYNYWYKYPVISLDWSNFDERVLARYLVLQTSHHPENKIVVYSSEPEYDYWSFLFYGNHLENADLQDIATQMRTYPPYVSKSASYTYGAIEFTNTCVPPEETLQAQSQTHNTLSIVRTTHNTCPENDTLLSDLVDKHDVKIKTISAVLDSGGRLKIIGDTICDGSTTSFVYLQSLSELQVEKQSTEEFCKNWIKSTD